MKILLVIIAFAIVPRVPVVEAHVDVIELNHFYDEHARPVFDQLIFYSWCDTAGRFEVVAWRLLKTAAQIPLPARGGYEAMWLDTDILRRVRAVTWRETWTQYDPELIEREWVPREHRKELGKGAAP